MTGEGSTPEKIKGECFCGDCRLEVVGKPIFSVYCHCTICQRLSGAPYVHCIGFPSSSLNITGGAKSLNPVKSSDAITRYFCKNCNASVYNQSHLDDFDFRDVCGSMLERDADGKLLHMNYDIFRPKCHNFYPQRVADVNDNLPKFDEYPTNI